MAKSVCSRAYHHMDLDQLDVFTTGVKTGIFSHDPPFTAPPITQVAYALLITNYITTRSAYKNGGLAQKGAFLAALAALLAGTDEFADYVDEVADGDANVITDAGFEPTDIIKTPAVKPGQAVVTVKRGIGGQLISNCEKVTGVTYYGCLIVDGGPLPPGTMITADGKLMFQPFNGPIPLPINSIQFDLNKQREKTFSGLVHDHTYYFYYYLVNAAGVGPLSEPVSIVCW